MRRATQIMIGVVVVFSAGCGAQPFSPRSHSTKQHGFSYVQGNWHPSAVFIHNDTTEEKFAAAVDHLKKTKIRELILQSTRLTDKSISDLLELERVDTLLVNGTYFTVEGMLRLKALPRLKRLYVAEGQFTDAEQERIRTALPNIEIFTSGGPRKLRNEPEDF